jgi:hypothetical protein
MRKAADRRHEHHRRGPLAVGAAGAELAEVDGFEYVPRPAGSVTTAGVSAERAAGANGSDKHMVGSLEVEGDGPLVVREKTHAAQPMGLDQALYEMELVGHDFYLFVDSESKLPSVVYRRRGYDYGVIRLDEAAGFAEPLAQYGGRAAA